LERELGMVNVQNLVCWSFGRTFFHHCCCLKKLGHTFSQVLFPISAVYLYVFLRFYFYYCKKYILFVIVDHEDLQLGSLSHYIKQRASGYEPLPPFPDHPPPNDVRNVEPIVAPEDSKLYKKSVLITKLVAPQHGNIFDNNISGQKGQRHVFVGVWKFTRP
jgi:hypothetical protein